MGSTKTSQTKPWIMKNKLWSRSSLLDLYMERGRRLHCLMLMLYIFPTLTERERERERDLRATSWRCCAIGEQRAEGYQMTWVVTVNKQRASRREQGTMTSEERGSMTCKKGARSNDSWEESRSKSCDRYCQTQRWKKEGEKREFNQRKKVLLLLPFFYKKMNRVILIGTKTYPESIPTLPHISRKRS